MWFVRLMKLLYKRRYFAALSTRIPIIGDIIEKIAFEGDTLYCLPKDQVIQLNESLLENQEIILPSQVVEYFVEKANHRWLMNFCICRDSNHCKDYPQDLGCLFLGEATTKINPKLGRHVTKEEAMQHLQKCREVGLVHFIGKVKGDSLWLGAKPEGKLLTICNCCPCCCISGMIKDIAPQIASGYLKMPGVEVKVSDRCVGCGNCAKICFIEAIRVINKRAVINEDMCRGCGRCVEKCSKKAIVITITDDQFITKTINHLLDHIDLN